MWSAASPDARGLITAVVQHAHTGVVLMVGAMNREALARTLADGRVTFFSRSRQCIWQKGETSGNTLALVELRIDCDGDALLVQALPAGPTCHTGKSSCFYRPAGVPLGDDDGPTPGIDATLAHTFATIARGKAGEGATSAG
ncbi:MAG: phosphoribosyl-AMP cyclohydrolase, partial [Deltaproteobacteria bacterium]|nr:phosphoribosyl-AMP cyclohydrolase [Nannocystaceae bacterium]